MHQRDSYHFPRNTMWLVHKTVLRNKHGKKGKKCTMKTQIHFKTWLLMLMEPDSVYSIWSDIQWGALIFECQLHHIICQSNGIKLCQCICDQSRRSSGGNAASKPHWRRYELNEHNIIRTMLNNWCALYIILEYDIIHVMIFERGDTTKELSIILRAESLGDEPGQLILICGSKMFCF